MKKLFFLILFALMVLLTVQGATAALYSDYTAFPDVVLGGMDNTNKAFCAKVAIVGSSYTLNNISFYSGAPTGNPTFRGEVWSNNAAATPDEPDNLLHYFANSTAISSGWNSFVDAGADFTLSDGSTYWFCERGDSVDASNKAAVYGDYVVGIYNGTYSNSALPETWTFDTGFYASYKLYLTAVAPPPATVFTTYSLNITNLYNDSNLDGVNVTFGSGCWNTSVGGIATVSDNATECAGLTGTINVNASLAGYYFNSSSYAIAANSTSAAGAYEGYVNVTSITRLIDSAVLSAANDTWIVNTSEKSYAECAATYPCKIYLTNGSNPLTLQSTGYYNKSFSVSITAPETTTTTITGVYDALLFVNASNAYTGALINNFTINVSNATEGYTASYTATTGNVSIPAVYGLGGIGFFLLADSDGYALANHTILPASAAPAYEFELWSNNSIYINIFNEDSGAPLYSNVTIIVTGDASEDTYYTVSSHLFVQNLTDGNYTVKLQAANYTLKTYSVTVADRSTQILNAYLSASTDTVIFTARNTLSAANVEGVSVGMYRLINATLTLVESKNTDITGRAQFTYSNGVRYSFIFSKTGFTTRTFSLDPIIFSSYDVGITPLLSETYDYNDVGHYYSPHTFYNDENNSFTFAINSPGGILTQYNVTVSWGNGTWTSGGSNANGGSLSTSINITGASLFDTVNVTYTYITVFGYSKTFSFLNGIIGGATDTIIGNRTETYGLGLFERILFATFLVIVFAGLATLFTNSTFGLVVGMLVMGIMTYLSFIPLLMMLISALLGVLVMWKQGGGY